jgi:CBS-domain-containing membrane protein
MWYEPAHHGTMFVDLKFYCNPEPFHMGPKASLARAYRLFRGMGLRTLPVVDENHKVCGVITRQDLLHDSIHQGIEGAMQRRPSLMRSAEGAGRVTHAHGHH